MYHFNKVWKQLHLHMIFQDFLRKILIRTNCFQTSEKWYICDYLSELWWITLAPIKHGHHRYWNWIFLLILPLCSTFSNGSHVGWSAGTSERIFKLDTMRIKKRKFDNNFNNKILKRVNCFQTSGKWYICDYLSELWLITLATIKHGCHRYSCGTVALLLW
jgi:hypothetical protein